MQEQYKFLAVIADFTMREKLSHVMNNYHALPKAITHGSGFADSEMLELLGFTENRKVVALLTLDASLVSGFYDELERELKISEKGMGIAFTVPLSAASGFCGKLMQLTAIKNEQKGAEIMPKKFAYTHELIVSIVTKGEAEHVKEAAKASGAKGGTMVHGLGLGGEEAARFLGIPIQEEKDIVLIVVHKEERDEVMKAIVSACGIESEARGICFSLPVDSAVGLR
ncbi:MAG: P-II family nitrogen regulator [Oscillospiraceae bacterium]|nr:P-II family nitrogen regulator [Oscillospiraceae bacterium]